MFKSLGAVKVVAPIVHYMSFRCVILVVVSNIVVHHVRLCNFKWGSSNVAQELVLSTFSKNIIAVIKSLHAVLLNEIVVVSVPLQIKLHNRVELKLIAHRISRWMRFVLQMKDSYLIKQSEVRSFGKVTDLFV